MQSIGTAGKNGWWVGKARLYDNDQYDDDNDNDDDDDINGKWLIYR